MPNLSSKRLPARIWLKKAVSLCFHKRKSIAGPGPSKMPNLSSKRFPARIWCRYLFRFSFFCGLPACTLPARLFRAVWCPYLLRFSFFAACVPVLCRFVCFVAFGARVCFVFSFFFAVCVPVLGLEALFFSNLVAQGMTRDIIEGGKGKK